MSTYHSILSASRGLCIAVAALVCASCAGSMSGKELVGTTVPATRVQMMSGEYVPLDEYRGKTVVVTFWATWCSRSNQTLSKIGDLAQQYRSRPNLVFLNVSVDKAENLERVETRLRDPRLSETQNAFSGNAEMDEAFMSFRCNELPKIFIVDPAGVIVAAGDSADVVTDYLG